MPETTNATPDVERVSDDILCLLIHHAQFTEMRSALTELLRQRETAHYRQHKSGCEARLKDDVQFWCPLCSPPPKNSETFKASAANCSRCIGVLMHRIHPGDCTCGYDALEPYLKGQP